MMTVYRVTVNGKDTFEVENVSIGHTAKSTINDLPSKECDTLEVTNTNLDVTTIYHKPHFDNGLFRYISKS